MQEGMETLAAMQLYVPSFVFLCFLTFLRKIFTSRPFFKRFQKMDPELAAVDHGAEVLGLKTISVTLL
jgi:hypothetical protein